MIRLAPLFAAAALAVLPFAVAAQPADADTAATIRLEASGQVRVSTGGEFSDAIPGQTLAPGHRVMVGEGASVTLAYPDGCRQRIDAVGVHLVPSRCSTDGDRPPANTGMIVGIGAGVAGLAAIAGGGGGGGRDTPPPPPPPVSR